MDTKDKEEKEKNPHTAEVIPKRENFQADTEKKTYTGRIDIYTHIHNQNQLHCYNFHQNNTPIYKHHSPNPTNQEDTALVILATKTNLSETQKTLLRKGLTFVPKPKHLDIQSLHQDIRKFMHKLKTIYEIKPQPT